MTRYPKRYFAGLSEYAKRLRRKELELRRVDPNPTLGRSDHIFLRSGKARKSSFTKKIRALFPDATDVPSLSKRTGIPVKILDQVYLKGLGAWKSGGSRPGATAHQWALARVYKFVLIALGYHSSDPKDPDLHLHVSFVKTHKAKPIPK